MFDSLLAHLNRISPGSETCLFLLSFLNPRNIHIRLLRSVVQHWDLKIYPLGSMDSASASEADVISFCQQVLSAWRGCSIVHLEKGAEDQFSIMPYAQDAILFKYTCTGMRQDWDLRRKCWMNGRAALVDFRSTQEGKENTIEIFSHLLRLLSSLRSNRSFFTEGFLGCCGIAWSIRK
jgi:hypothetical protein